MRPHKILSLLALTTVAVFGTAGPTSASSDAGKITNGQAASPGEYPFMVALVQPGVPDNFQAQFCGASLIDPSWVLTAAHCLYDEATGATSPDAVQVLVGAVDLSTGEGTRVNVSEVHVHESYEPASSTNDIALLRLAAPQSAAPIARSTAGDGLENPGTTLTLTGWGGLTVDQENQTYATVLQEAAMPVVADDVCASQIGSFDPGTVVCAGAPESDADGGIDACQGDSGGPLFATLQNGQRVQVGLVSWGPTCGLTLSAYTSVAAFESWIDGVMGGGTTPTELQVMERVAGATRYATAAQLAVTNWVPPVDTVFVVTGASFPDALATGPVAMMYGGPILLTQRDTLPSETAGALGSLQPRQVVVVGGIGAVSDGVLAQLGAFTTGGGARRIAGFNRYETAVALSQDAFAGGLNEGASLVMLASGSSFADAVGASAASAAEPPNPLLLTDPSYLPAETAAELQRLGPASVWVLGGPGAVSEAVVDELLGMGFSVERIAGNDRFETAALLAERIFGGSGLPVIVTTGMNFPDALVAGALGMPLLLLPPGSVPGSVESALRTLGSPFGFILGGTGAVSDVQAVVVDGIVAGTSVG